MNRYFLLNFLLTVICIIAAPSIIHSSVSSIPTKIKVLILDDSSAPLPEKGEQLQKMDGIKGTLLAKNNSYTGNIEVWKGDKGLYIINELPLEDYVENVVAAEMGPNWDIEALKAQAVIARTYAVHRKTVSDNPRFDLTSSVMSQAYKGNSPNIQAIYAAKETASEILTYNGKPIEALYHSTCGGMTESSEDVFGKTYPYMKPVASSCELSPYWTWERKIPLELMENVLTVKTIKNIAVNSLTSTGRVKDLSIESSAGRTLVKATELRKLLGWNKLPSTNFRLSMSGENIIFEGKGYGHGVGLCQWSALQMAREGKKYKDILSYFYPGTEIKLYEGN